jgi:RNA polymerase sigma-70 factor (ECF subfamily)
MERLQDYLLTMNPDRARAVLLHDALGYDLSEICALTGATYAAAQTRVSRGRRELRRAL